MNAKGFVRTWQSSRRGFTIVELLIVVVVIAILAAITVVSYNGITRRAQYTVIADTVNKYKEALALYKIDNGEYPLFGGPGMTGFCLGKDYPDYDSDGLGDCINDHDFERFNFDEDDTINAELAEYIPSLPAIQKEGFMADGHRFNGLMYLYDPYIRVDGEWAGRSIIFYYLEGVNQDCQVPVLNYVGSGSDIGLNGDPSDYLFETSNPNRYSFSNGFATACAFLLDN